LATLAPQATKARAHGLFFSYKPNNCMFMYISSELHKFSLYKYKHIARHFSRALNIQKEFNLSPKNSILSREYSKKYS